MKFFDMYCIPACHGIFVGHHLHICPKGLEAALESSQFTFALIGLVHNNKDDHSMARQVEPQPCAKESG